MRKSVLLYKMLSSALLACGLVSHAIAKKPSWTSTHIDPFGYVPISSFGSSSNVDRLFRLIDVEPDAAFRRLSDMYDKEPDDSIVAYGFLLSSLRARKLIDATERIAKRYVLLEQRNTKLSKVPVPDDIAIQYQLALAMLYSDQVPGGDRDYLKRLRVNSRVLYGTLSGVVPNSHKLGRAYALMYGSAAYLKNNHSGLRRVLQSYVDDSKADYAMYLILCKDYRRGVVAMSDGQSNPLPVPESDKPKPELAKRAALAALKLHLPTLEAKLDANYYGGLYYQGDNNLKAKSCWSEFLRLLPASRDDKRRQFVKTELGKL